MATNHLFLATGRALCAVCCLALAPAALPAASEFDADTLASAPGALLAAELGRHVLADDVTVPVSRDVGTSPALGFRIGRYLAFETSHLALGVTPAATFALARPADPAASFVGAGMMSGLAVLPLHDDLDVYLRLALPVDAYLLDDAGLVTPGPYATPTARSAGDLLWGIGLGYRIDEHWTGRFDLYDVSGYDFLRNDPLSNESLELLFSIGLRYSF